MTIREELTALEERMKVSYTGADIDKLKALKKALAEQPDKVADKPEAPKEEKPAPAKKKVAIKTKKATKKKRK